MFLPRFGTRPHPTATCGSVGAAVGLAAMLDFGPREMNNALAAAAVSASGTLKVIEDGSELKPFNVGRAAVVGLASAMMGRAGFDGPTNALSGDTGFLRMMCDGYDACRLLEPCDSGFWILNAYVKPYAACRHAHPSIEACMRIRRHTGIRPDEVREVCITTYDGLAGKHDHRTASCVSSAKMSIPYGVAIALVTDRAGVHEFTPETVRDPLVRSLASKVRIVADEKFTALVPAKRSALVKITTMDGVVHQELVEHPKGEPENPLTDDELEEKFRSLAEYGQRPPRNIDNVVDAVWRLPAHLSDLFPHL